MKTSITTEAGTTLLHYSLHETPLGSEFVILEKVEMGYHCAVEIPLDDPHDREFFSKLLTQKTGFDAYESVEDAIEHEKEWREVA